jgi:hypothetical protein
VSLALIGFGREWSVAFRIKAMLKNSEILLRTARTHVDDHEKGDRDLLVCKGVFAVAKECMVIRRNVMVF